MGSHEADNATLARARNGERPATVAVVEGLRSRIARLALYYASRCREEPVRYLGTTGPDLLGYVLDG